MRILVVGAYGLIGSYITARLLAVGHEVIGLGRDVSGARLQAPQVRWIAADLRRLDVAGWIPLLEDVDAVVNCAGALQDGPRDNLEAVHQSATAALAAACVTAGVQRVVQISAVGIDRAETPFERTKLAAEQALKASPLQWIILRPGLVLAPTAYGGSALLRGLAALPWAIPAANPDAVVQTISIEDVAEAVLRSVEGASSRFACDLVAAEETRLRDVLQLLRAWLGLRPVPVVALPSVLAGLSGLIADGLAWFGWRSPLRTTALRQLAAGVEGRSTDPAGYLGMSVSGPQQTLSRWPAGVQERWFARLYFVKPLALIILAVFWAASGLVGMARAPAAAGLLTGAGFPTGVAGALVLAGSVVDLGLAGLVCVRRTARTALCGMILVTAAYLVAASIWLPWLWTDPLGPLVKSVPAGVLALAALAIMDER